MMVSRAADDVHGASEVVDPAAFERLNEAWRGRWAGPRSAPIGTPALAGLHCKFGDLQR
jgi:hypothetical protein